MGSSSRNLVAAANRGSGRLGLIGCSPTTLLDFVTDQLVVSVVWWENKVYTWHRTSTFSVYCWHYIIIFNGGFLR